MNKKGIIFDLDGTLWDTTKQVVPAWNIVLNRYPDLHKQITIEDMKSFMGKTIEDIAKIMLPNLEVESQLKIMHECCVEEQKYLTEHGGILYKNLETVLDILHEKYSLYIVSNCQDGYVQTFLTYHQLDQYFEDIEMSGRTGKNKGENIKLIMMRNHLNQAIYVGDTTGDLQGANIAQIPFVYANYGFGHVENQKYIINSIEELLIVAAHLL